jgi:hypothetical protein
VIGAPTHQARLNPIVLCLAAMPGDAGDYQFRSCLADPLSYRQKLLHFYEATWETYDEALREKALPSLVLWDLFCTATVVEAPDAARKVAQVSYMLQPGDQMNITPRRDLFSALFRPILDAMKTHKGGCTAMPHKAKPPWPQPCRPLFECQALF